MLKLFEKCPGCGGPLVVTECRCEGCHLVMRAEFQPDLFSTLSTDQLTFIREFLRVRGNLSELEKVLGVSYPTIRNKLDEINLVLDRAGVPTTSPAPVAGPAAAVTEGGDVVRQAILRQVAAGEISPVEGVLRLKNLQGDK